MSARVLALNCIRFAMNYSWFEDDAKPFTYDAEAWAWLDQNVAWGRRPSSQ